MEKMKYKISSRATILLGRESVSKVDGAIIELIKNTYDADALICLMCFDLNNDCIYILDNGSGMTKDTIENNWMMIGTDNKKIEYQSVRNRIKSGEKGIGRFALDRLGSKCEMLTKHKQSPKLIYWETDWSNFEKTGQTLDKIDAHFTYLEGQLIDHIPDEILNDVMSVDESNIIEEDISLETGTLLKISGLRDSWTPKSMTNITKSMGFLIPPIEQKDYVICIKTSLEEDYTIIQNEISEEYDYKLSSEFDGEKFTITLDRNEFDLKKIPLEVFDLDDFREYPYTHADFKKGVFQYVYSISEIMNSRDEALISAIKKIGPFNFNYTFMKMSMNEDSNEVFYYKEISKNRRLWLNVHGGIKIYRDNFLVRPYGDQSAEAFDWLGLDARKATSPDAISHSSGRWKVRNRQGQGTVFISRVNNSPILDKSSREGIIENEYFALLRSVIRSIISIFEKDRAHIGRGMKKYSDIVNERDKTKKEGKDLADKILEEENSEGKDKAQSEEVVRLAKAVQYFEEEREELITEIKLLRSLATNGLITTSIVHDLKGINAILVSRVESFEFVIRSQNEKLINRNLDDLLKNDMFLKSWITVITNQIKKDKRKRLKKDIYQTIEEIIDVLEPILKQKKINIELAGDDKLVFKRIFVSDFESILYNLIINSIEALEKSKVLERKISITLETGADFTIHYKDNGAGLAGVFKNPYDIFKFGITSKYDKDGEIVGTGLGMYIVASTAREYNAQYIITESENGFGLDLKFPL